jgi:serine/threonine-protein kinase
VRQALDHGITDDPELTADLLPAAARSGVANSAVETGELDALSIFDQDQEFTTRIPAASVGAAPSILEPQNLAHNQPPRQTPPPVVAAEPRTYRAPRRSRRGLFLLIGVLAIALLVGIGAWQLGRYTTTPSVISFSQSAAKAKITGAGLKFKIGTPAYSEKYTKGAVMDTNPAPGDRVAKGGTVTVIMSLGPERHAVPVVRDKTLDEVQQLLQDASLSVGEIKQMYSESVPAGRVVTTDPVVGTLLRRDTAVDILVSRGPKPVTITDWTGKKLVDAKKALETAGFQVTVDQQFDDKIPKGTVISQSPNAGQGVQGDMITLVVSKGPELFAIPHVRGMRTNDARRTLEDAGFKVQVVRSDLYVGANYVVTVSPSEGTMVPKGTTVTITVF